ncbi:MAG: hypothetical protein DCO96_13200 [Fluviicola sp. XM-24bin1]|nr:MAG: hypothetical protein DCO96_13200 [Fluviicola sp. XM-24bin1]
MSETLDNTAAESAKRPAFLTVLCILTFIGSGLSALIYLLATIAFGVVGGMFESIPGMDVFADAGMAFFAIYFVLAAVSLFGAIQMWKLKKNGFYMYAGANVVGFLLPMFMIEGMPFNVMGFVFLALWITLYGLNLKHMS